METRWVTVDGVNLPLPETCTADEIRSALHKPDDSVLIAVTDDLVSVVHEEERPLTEMVAGCADAYYFKRPSEAARNDILAAPEIETALTDPTTDETTFQRPSIDH